MRKYLRVRDVINLLMGHGSIGPHTHTHKCIRHVLFLTHISPPLLPSGSSLSFAVPYFCYIIKSAKGMHVVINTTSKALLQ